jgi:hypothetical protein
MFKVSFKFMVLEDIPLAFQELAGELSVYFPFGEINTASSSYLCIVLEGGFIHGVLEKFIEPATAAGRLMASIDPHLSPVCRLCQRRI